MSAFLISTLKTIIMLLIASTAIGLASVAVTIGRRAPRQSGHFGGPSSQAKWADTPADRKKHPSAGAALRSADAGSVRSAPSGPDAARIDPMDVFEGCWRRPRGV
jgi:hypothetical protein